MMKRLLPRMMVFVAYFTVLMLIAAAAGILK
jgi:hypothetical protein